MDNKITAQLLDESERWIAESFERDGWGRHVPPIWPKAPFLLESESLQGTTRVYVLQARDIGKYHSEGGIEAFERAVFESQMPSSEDAPGVLVSEFIVPEGGALRQTINPSFPWLAIWTDADSEFCTLRASSLATFQRGPSRLALKAAPKYEYEGEPA